MNLLESKVIQTKFEKEIFIDQISNIEISNVNYQGENASYYELMVGLEFLRIRNNDFYGTTKSYFGIRIEKDIQDIIVFEPKQQSIFAVKNENEKDAAIELIEYLLTASPHFKQLVGDMINDFQQDDVICEKDIKELKSKIVVLEQILNISYDDLKFERKENNRLIQ
jgi:hypothetical protein